MPKPGNVPACPGAVRGGAAPGRYVSFVIEYPPIPVCYPLRNGVARHYIACRYTQRTRKWSSIRQVPLYLD